VSREKSCRVWWDLSFSYYVSRGYSDDKKKLPYVAAGTEVPRFSSARLPESDVADHMDLYESADWFPALQHGKPEVLEMTIKMPLFSAGLTLLWFVDR